MGIAVFAFTVIVVQMRPFQIAGGLLVSGLGGCQIPQQFTCAGIRGSLRCVPVEPFRITFHRFCFGSNTVQSQVLDQPDRPPGIIARHMLTPDQRNGRAKPLFVKRDELRPVVVFFRGHPLEHFGGSRKL